MRIPNFNIVYMKGIENSSCSSLLLFCRASCVRVMGRNLSVPELSHNRHYMQFNCFVTYVRHVVPCTNVLSVSYPLSPRAASFRLCPIWSWPLLCPSADNWRTFYELATFWPQLLWGKYSTVEVSSLSIQRPTVVLLMWSIGDDTRSTMSFWWPLGTSSTGLMCISVRQVLYLAIKPKVFSIVRPARYLPKVSGLSQALGFPSPIKCRVNSSLPPLSSLWVQVQLIMAPSTCGGEKGFSNQPWLNVLLPS